MKTFTKKLSELVSDKRQKLLKWFKKLSRNKWLFKFLLVVVWKLIDKFDS